VPPRISLLTLLLLCAGRFRYAHHMFANTPKQPWDRRRGESNSAYAHFLLYRNLGPARSIDRAYAAYQATSEVNDIATDEDAARRGKTRRAPGNWWKEAAAYEWESRAAAWDVAVLADTGRRAVAAFCALVEQTSLRCLAAVLNGEIAPEDWTKLIKTIRTL